MKKRLYLKPLFLTIHMITFIDLTRMNSLDSQEDSEQMQVCTDMLVHLKAKLVTLLNAVVACGGSYTELRHDEKNDQHPKVTEHASTQRGLQLMRILAQQFENKMKELERKHKHEIETLKNEQKKEVEEQAKQEWSSEIARITTENEQLKLQSEHLLQEIDQEHQAKKVIKKQLNQLKKQMQLMSGEAEKQHAIDVANKIKTVKKELLEESRQKLVVQKEKFDQKMLALDEKMLSLESKNHAYELKSKELAQENKQLKKYEEESVLLKQEKEAVEKKALLHVTTLKEVTRRLLKKQEEIEDLKKHVSERSEEINQWQQEYEKNKLRIEENKKLIDEQQDKITEYETYFGLAQKEIEEQKKEIKRCYKWIDRILGDGRIKIDLVEFIKKYDHL